MSSPHEISLRSNEEQQATVIDQITIDVLRQQLREFSSLNRTALLNALTPHRDLPFHDPARYIMAAYSDPSFLNEAREGSDLVVPETEDVELGSGFDIGVAFARSLASRVFSADTLPPVIDDFNPDNKQRVVHYLNGAMQRAKQHTLEPDMAVPPDLKEALELFIEQCKVNLSDLVIGGGKLEIHRGFTVYFKTLSLLESGELHPSAIKRFLSKLITLTDTRERPL